MNSGICFLAQCLFVSFHIWFDSKNPNIDSKIDVIKCLPDSPQNVLTVSLPDLTLNVLLLMPINWSSSHDFAVAILFTFEKKENVTVQTYLTLIHRIDNLVTISDNFSSLELQIIVRCKTFIYSFFFYFFLFIISHLKWFL